MGEEAHNSNTIPMYKSDMVERTSVDIGSQAIVEPLSPRHRMPKMYKVVRERLCKALRDTAPQLGPETRACKAQVLSIRSGVPHGEFLSFVTFLFSRVLVRMGMIGIAGVVVDPVEDYTRKVTMLAAKT